MFHITLLFKMVTMETVFTTSNNSGIAEDIQFTDLFNIQDIQRIQDVFSKATGVASLITKPDGTPITKPSNFCRLCNEIIRKTEKGLKLLSRLRQAIGMAAGSRQSETTAGQIIFTPN